MYPLSDNYMVFNENTNRYVLQEQDLINLGINLGSERYSKVAITALLEQISQQVYSKIHSYNIANEYQDWVISHTKSGREIVKEAMEEQLKYVLLVGDLRRSTDKEKRSMWFDETAQSILERTLPEIGCPIIYTGVFRRVLK